jgi:hypothetical protein
VEGVRTDIRVVNLSLLNTDWYIDQLKRKYYQSDAINISWKQEQYILGRRDYIPFYDRNVQGAVELKELVDFMGSDEQSCKATTQGGETINYFPTKNIKITIDSAAVMANHVVAPENAGKIVKEMDITLEGSYLMKNDLMILNILANNNWKRPIYFATTVGSENYLNLQNYFQLEGLTYRVVPIYTPSDNEMSIGRVATDTMYRNVMSRFVWGNMNDERVYLDENNQRMTTNIRINFSRLAEALIMEGKKDSAVKVLDKCLEVTPDKTIPYNYFMINMAILYYRAAGVYGMEDSLTQNAAEQTRNKELIAKGNQILERISEIYGNNMDYYLSLKGTKYFKLVDTEMNQALYILQATSNVVKQSNQADLSAKLEKRFNDVAQRSGF